MKRKCCRILSLLLLLIFTAALVGCSGTEKDSEGKGQAANKTPVPQPAELAGSVTLSTYLSSGNDTSAFDFISDFILQYPGVEVAEDHEFNYEQYFATLDERVENGTIGDVFVVDSDRLAFYAEKGWIMDLTPYLSGLIEYTSGKYNKLNPGQLYYEAAYEDAIYNGNLYMVPTEYENKAVLVNLDLFEAAGLSVPKDDWTWDDVLDCVKALQENGCADPLSMDYTDFSVWGAFAMREGGELFRKPDSAEGETCLNLTDAKVVNGLRYLAENFIANGYLAEKTPAEISAEELSQYGMLVISHADLGKWAAELKKGTMNWEFAHFPRAVAGSDEGFGIGVKTLGLAVRVRKPDEIGDDEMDLEMLEDIGAQLALYAMVPEAAVDLCGTSGQRVPALMSANEKRFWRDYPVLGKNTSVFSRFSKYDYAATLSAYMSLDAAGEIEREMGEALARYAAQPEGESLDELLQQIQNYANANW